MVRGDSLTYNQRAIRIGSAVMIGGIIANFAPAVYIYLAYGLIPPIPDIIKIWTVCAVTFGISWVIQPITYFSLLGPSGEYIGWLAGSNADIRCPGVAMAQKAAGVEASTPEGDVISTIGIAGTVFTSVTIVTICVLLGQSILEILPPFVTNSFKYVLTSVFGAVYVQLACKNLGMGAWTIILAIAVSYVWQIAHLPGWILNIIIIVMGVLIARYYFVKNQKKEASY